MTVTLDRDAAALCAAVDAGDDGALPYLADALEEEGNPRAAGLRACAFLGWRPRASTNKHHTLWHWDRWEGDGRGVFDGGSYHPTSTLAPEQLARLPGVQTRSQRRQDHLTRSAAFLALALALTEVPRRVP